MKVLVLGDSHTAAVKFGWEDIKSTQPDIEVDFFALPGERIRFLEAKSGTIVLSGQAPKGNQKLFKSAFPSGHIKPMD